MIEFLTEEIRTQFHLLPLEKQIEVTQAAERFFIGGKVITVLFADAETSEICIRIDEKFDVGLPGGSIESDHI